jgi:hypothetical protein
MQQLLKSCCIFSKKMGKIIKIGKKVVASPVFEAKNEAEKLDILQASKEAVIFRVVIILLIHLVFGGLVIWSMYSYAGLVFSVAMALFGEGLILLAMMSGIKYEIAFEQSKAKKGAEILRGRLLPLLPTMKNDKARSYIFVAAYVLFVVVKIAISSYTNASQERLTETDTLKLHTAKSVFVSDSTTITETKKAEIARFTEKRDNEVKAKMSKLLDDKRIIESALGWLKKTGQNTGLRERELAGIETKIKNVSASSRWQDSITEITAFYNTKMESAIKKYDTAISGIEKSVKTATGSHKKESVWLSIVVGIVLFLLIIAQKVMYKDVLTLHYVFNIFAKKAEKEVIDDNVGDTREVRNKDTKALIESVIIDGKRVAYGTAVSWTRRKNVVQLKRLEMELNLKGYSVRFQDGYIRVFEKIA